MTLTQIIIPLAWTLIMVFALLYVKNNKRFPVTYFSGVGYKVEASPSLSWSKTSGWNVILGFVFLGITWAGFILIGTDIITFPEKSNGATWSVAIPTVLSAISFFAGYSSRLVNNYVHIDKFDFEKFIADGDIQKRGEKDYVDTSKKEILKHLFDYKEWIR